MKTMQTYSHFLLTAALIKPLGKLQKRYPDKIPEIRNSAILLGSIIPDIALIIMAVVAAIRDYTMGVFSSAEFQNQDLYLKASSELLNLSWLAYLFDVAFFENIWVISLHNLFHSPLLVFIFISLSYVLWKKQTRSAGWFFWLCCAAMLHTLCDIPIHANDGPLLLFPFDLNMRFISPISYWDPQFYGEQWSLFEHSMDAVLLIYLGFIVFKWQRSRQCGDKA